MKRLMFLFFSLIPLCLCGSLLAQASQPASKGARYHPPSKWVLGPWYGTGFPDFGRSCGSYGKTLEDEINYDLDNLIKHDIPITCYHCDGTSWARNDTITLSDAMIQRLREKKIRLLLHLWGQDDLPGRRLGAGCGRASAACFQRASSCPRPTTSSRPTTLTRTAARPRRSISAVCIGARCRS
ncbi:MAG: hypothetical protein ABFD92_07145 [Planctomycetaceae bacterium]|nr:hypothetical protein [Planctomycetaceae bacterium]